MARFPGEPVPVLFHPAQMAHRPLLEWAFGKRLRHPETSRRAERILAALGRHPRSFPVQAPRRIPLALIRRVHHHRLLTLYQTARSLPEDQTFHPSVFPKRSQCVGDPFDIHQAGYFCFDSGTPLHARTWEAAAWSAACAVEAAALVARRTTRLAYALSRPPGHHASRDLMGGYCYLNNAAVAVERLRGAGRIAVLDIDFHHGNGTQSIYWRDPDVLFVSIHGDPRQFYPYFSGYASEVGAGRGVGATRNLPLDAGADGDDYLDVLRREALPAITRFDPTALVVSAGFDTWRDDPIGDFTLETGDIERIGEAIGTLRLPAVVVQEGGYATEALGQNVIAFLAGMRRTGG